MSLGCIIPPFLSQINSASNSFGDLWFQHTQHIFWVSWRWSLMKRNRFDPIAHYWENVQNVPKYPYFLLIWQLLKIIDISARFGCFGPFLSTEWQDQANSFSWAISVSWHKFRLRNFFFGKTNMFLISWNYRWPNKTLTDII